MFEDISILIHLVLVGLSAANVGSALHTQSRRHLPRMLPRPSNATYEVGQLAILKCGVENLGRKRNVGWRRASQSSPLTIGTMTFVSDHRIQVEHPPMSNEWNLLIKKVQLDDAGVYECQVASKVRHLRHHVLLMVKEPVIPKMKHNIQIIGAPFVEKGERIYLQCNATGRDNPPDDLDWFKNGNKMTTEFAKKVYIRKFVSLTTKTIVSILEIKDAKLSDAGIYVCRTSDLQITSKRVNILNAGTSNVKRGTATKQDNESVTGPNGSGSRKQSDVLQCITISLGIATWTLFKYLHLCPS